MTAARRSRKVTLDRPVLTIDPRRQFGAVCVAGTRIPAEAVGECVTAGDGVDEVADDYEITRDEVLLCCLWYVREACDGRSKAARRLTAA